jgi:hypothetical protein
MVNAAADLVPGAGLAFIREPSGACGKSHLADSIRCRSLSYQSESHDL